MINHCNCSVKCQTLETPGKHLNVPLSDYSSFVDGLSCHLTTSRWIPQTPTIHGFLTRSLPATSTACWIVTPAIFYTTCLFCNITKHNFLLHYCRWTEFSQGTGWKFQHCFTVWYFMSQIPGWKAMHFCVLCDGTPCSLNQQYCPNERKCEKGASYTI